MKDNKNKRLAFDWDSFLKSEQLVEGGEPNRLSNLLKSQKEKGGELEGMT